MTCFDFSIDYNVLKIKENERLAIESQGGSKFVFENFILSLTTAKYPRGLSGLKLRVFGRILEKIDSSIGYKFDLEAAEVDLLKEIILSDDIEVLPQQIRLYSYYRKKFEESLQINS